MFDLVIAGALVGSSILMLALATTVSVQYPSVGLVAFLIVAWCWKMAGRWEDRTRRKQAAMAEDERVSLLEWQEARRQDRRAQHRQWEEEGFLSDYL